MSKLRTKLLVPVRDFLEACDEPVARDFVAGFDWFLPERPLEPAALPCLRHLDEAARLAPGRCGMLAKALLARHDALCWRQTYTSADFGLDFLDGYGWTEIFGTRGHFACGGMAGGFLLLGPGIEYPDHHHVAEEIYIPLTGGAEWRKADAPYAIRPAGTVIRHPSQVSHAMRTGKEPLLAFYLWRGGPLAQKSIVEPARRAGG